MLCPDRARRLFRRRRALPELLGLAACLGALTACGAGAPNALSNTGVTAAVQSRPAGLKPPAISGLAQVGQRLTASRGAWSPRPTSFKYSWKRCDRVGGHCKSIRHAGASRYRLGKGDVGATLRVAVTASNRAGRSKPALSAHTAVVTATVQPSPAAVQHLEYVLNDGLISVYDMDNSFRLINSFTLPGIDRGVRGVAVSPATHVMFVSYGGDGGGNGNGSVLAYDLVSKKVLWSVNLATGIDSGAVSADGKRLYMPTGELSSGGVWDVLDTANGNVVGKIESPASGPHNTVLSADGKLLLLGGRAHRGLPVYDAQTLKLQVQVGPMVNTVRPLTVNGSDSISFTTATEFDGFQVGCITCPGAPLLYTESFGLLPARFPFTTASHGISLTPDSREVAVLDAVHKAVQFWNVEGVDRKIAPRHLADVPVAGLEGSESGCTYDCGRDGWVQHSVDGRYVFVGDSGSVIESATHKVIAYIAKLENTRKSIEVDWQNGVPVATSGRTGVGRTG
ncbi:MAG: hypothetical protein JWN81_510 [Solirubrobacterales bacterium]|nr:hypothetical protein [Solirubrobacterales bacterium]